MDEHDAQSGFVPMLGVTAEMAQKLLATDLKERGIDPKRAHFSRGVIAMRDKPFAKNA